MKLLDYNICGAIQLQQVLRPTAFSAHMLSTLPMLIRTWRQRMSRDAELVSNVLNDSAPRNENVLLTSDMHALLARTRCRPGQLLLFAKLRGATLQT